MFHLLYVDGWDGWDDQADEAAAGGRTLETLATAADAVARRAVWALAAPRMYGPGQLVITDGRHRRIDRLLDDLQRALARAA
jgi:hypothetical protein